MLRLTGNRFAFASLSINVNVKVQRFTLLQPDDKSDAGNFPDGLRPTHQPTLYKINKRPVSFVGKCHATENLS